METMTLGYASVHACGVYVLLKDQCSLIAIIGDVMNRKPEVLEIELAVVPKNDKKFLEYIEQEFGVISHNDFEIIFEHRGERICLTKVRKESWSAIMEGKVA